MRTLSIVVLCIMLGTACDDGGAADFSAGMKALNNKDYKEALKWLTKAAEKDHVEAQFYLGGMYYEGQGMEQPNYQEALKWYKKAADRMDGDRDIGHAEAQFHLGVMYHKGQGMEQPNYQEALKWWTIAGKKNHTGALNNIGVMYDKGNKVEKNFRKAHRSFLLSAQQGDTTAINNFLTLSSFRISKEESEYWDKLKRNEIDNWKPKQLSNSGSGFYITKEYILTNAHVVCSNDISSGQCDRYDEVRTPYYRLDTVTVDTKVDLALLKVVSSRKDSSSAKIRSGSGFQLGEDIGVFGYPLAEELSFKGNFTIGNVSAREGRPTSVIPSDFFQFTAPIQYGNSGGPVLDTAGNVVGVVVENYRDFDAYKKNEKDQDIFNIAQNINFAVSLKAIKNFLKDAGIEPYSSSKVSTPKEWIIWELEEALKKLANYPEKKDLMEKIKNLRNMRNSGLSERSEEMLNHDSPLEEWIDAEEEKLKKEDAGVELDLSYFLRPKKWTEVARVAEKFTVSILCFTDKK